MTHAVRRRLASSVITLGLVAAGAYAPTAPAFAARPTANRAGHTQRSSDTDAAARTLEVRYANAHWNWTAWNDSAPVAPGRAQPNYECAEFVARSLAAAGLVPGLGPNDPQNGYRAYSAPNGKVYDLLLISVLPQYNNLYAYLRDSGVGQDVGEQLGQAQPGDVVVTYLGTNGTASHTGLVAQAATATGEAGVDAHNNARLDYGYHYYAPSHLVRLAPNALSEVWGWAAAQRALHPAQPLPRRLPTPSATAATPSATAATPSATAAVPSAVPSATVSVPATASPSPAATATATGTATGTGSGLAEPGPAAPGIVDPGPIELGPLDPAAAQV
ncbi:amidase domain-containing protein [Streptacidiphilus sp. P02-A3a]|uniref:amidase domain-containing protein n=1 Tax=Streptacidiphilus sp. P02-A3a TaxID=2704468 RepID=UPI0015FA2E5C|nr:amidase domain-containing protein [Streptacidiphilus sp. P02-A3a]QMU70731.1 hypothetical protein GXP74_23490 [Streptacidiphilus sp. P02-A3a]